MLISKDNLTLFGLDLRFFMSAARYDNNIIMVISLMFVHF